MPPIASPGVACRTVPRFASRPFPIALLTLMLAVTLGTPARAQLFTDIGATSGATFVGGGRGVAWFDADGDGDPDVFAPDWYPGLSGPEMFFRNNGNGTFTATQYPLAGNPFSAVAADYDDDGDVDVFLTNGASGGSGHWLLQNDGAGNFTDVAAAAGLKDATVDARGAAWADFDGDRDLDLYVAALFGTSQLYRNNGDGSFSIVPSALLQVTNVRCVTWVDYDNDGDPDLFLGRYGNANRLLRNDGGTFVNVTPAVLARTGDLHGVAWGDYDRDGDLDVYLSYLDSIGWPSPCYLIRNDGAGNFTDVSGNAGLFVADASTGVAWSDIDRDGRLDLVRAVNGGSIQVLQNSNGFFSTAWSSPAGKWFGVALGDADGDGDPDLFASADSVSAAGWTAGTLFRNDVFSNNHWIQVDLVGSISNRFGIGARVTVVAGGVRQVREVSSGEGYLSTNAFTASFGLGTRTYADSIIVRWPSGIVTYLPLAGANYRYRIQERSGIAGVDTPAGPELALARAYPDPFTAVTRIDFTLPASGPVRLEILDVQGRRVASLVRGVLGAGSHAATWDGRDARGNRLGAGVYFAALESSGRLRTRRLVRLP